VFQSSTHRKPNRAHVPIISGKVLQEAFEVDEEINIFFHNTVSYVNHILSSGCLVIVHIHLNKSQVKLLWKCLTVSWQLKKTCQNLWKRKVSFSSACMHQWNVLPTKAAAVCALWHMWS